jgi:hypothetical protein
MGCQGISGGVLVVFCVRNGLGLAEKWTSVSPWFQAIRIAVNDELGAIETGAYTRPLFGPT